MGAFLFGVSNFFIYKWSQLPLQKIKLQEIIMRAYENMSLKRRNINEENKLNSNTCFYNSFSWML